VENSKVLLHRLQVFARCVKFTNSKFLSKSGSFPANLTNNKLLNIIYGFFFASQFPYRSVSPCALLSVAGIKKLNKLKILVYLEIFLLVVSNQSHGRFAQSFGFEGQVFEL